MSFWSTYHEVIDDVASTLHTRSRVAAGANAHLPRLLMKCKAGYVDSQNTEVTVRKEQAVALTVFDKGGHEIAAASFHEYLELLVIEMCALETAFDRALGGPDSYCDGFLDDDRFFAREFLGYIHSVLPVPTPLNLLFTRGLSSYVPMDRTRTARKHFDQAKAVRAMFLQRCGGAVELADLALEFLVGSAGHDLASFLLPRSATQAFLRDIAYQYDESYGGSRFADVHVANNIVGGVQAHGKFSFYSYRRKPNQPAWIKWRVAREGEFDESDDEADRADFGPG